MSTVIPEPPAVEYPDSDGKPMADNTVQFRYIVTIQGGLDALFSGDQDVFVAGDHLWYPVEGQPRIRAAPDVYVVFGRPKGDRGSYKQWEEDDIPPQVVFEILSPNNRTVEMLEKFDFYQQYGVEEYYVFDPDTGDLLGWRREGDAFRRIPDMQGFVSPRLGIQFAVENGVLQLYGPDGRPFASYADVVAQRDQAERRADAAEARAEQLAAQLRALGIAPPA
jgi:Uma2 family endonuclease